MSDWQSERYSLSEQRAEMLVEEGKTAEGSVCSAPMTLTSAET